MEDVVNWSNFVYHIAHKFRKAGHRCGLELEDLAQAGFEGYIVALKRVNPDATESEKTSYLKTRIYGSIIDSIRSHSKYSRLHYDAARKADNFDCLPYEVQFEDFALHFKVEPSTLTKLIAWDLVSLGLTPFEKHLVRMFFVNGCTMFEIAESFGFTESRISQLLTIAINKLRNICQVKPKGKSLTLKSFH